MKMCDKSLSLLLLFSKIKKKLTTYFGYILSAAKYKYLCFHVCLVATLCSTLCDPMDSNPPGSTVHGFPRQECWSGMPFPTPGDFSDPGTEPTSPALAGRFSTSESPKKVTAFSKMLKVDKLMKSNPLLLAHLHIQVKGFIKGQHTISYNNVGKLKLDDRIIFHHYKLCSLFKTQIIRKFRWSNSSAVKKASAGTEKQSWLDFIWCQFWICFSSLTTSGESFLGSVFLCISSEKLSKKKSSQQFIQVINSTILKNV